MAPDEGLPLAGSGGVMSVHDDPDPVSCAGSLRPGNDRPSALYRSNLIRAWVRCRQLGAPCWPGLAGCDRGRLKASRQAWAGRPR